MRSVKQIKEEIQKKSKQDLAYNMLQNEGGEGFEVCSTDGLYEELYAAIQEEFKKEWTLDVFTERRKKWNDYAISNNIVGICPQFFEFKKINGWGLDELKKAKELLGVIK